MSFWQIKNFAYGEINERSFSNPHPRTNADSIVNSDDPWYAVPAGLIQLEPNYQNQFISVKTLWDLLNTKTIIVVVPSVWNVSIMISRGTRRPQ